VFWVLQVRAKDHRCAQKIRPNRKGQHGTGEWTHGSAETRTEKEETERIDVRNKDARMPDPR